MRATLVCTLLGLTLACGNQEPPLPGEYEPCVLQGHSDDGIGLGCGPGLTCYRVAMDVRECRVPCGPFVPAQYEVCPNGRECDNSACD